LHRLLHTCAWLLALALTIAAPCHADEGLWTFDNFPLARVNQAYGLHLDQAWLDHVQRAAVRLNMGCSASVVSPDGLVFTNQHCVLDCAQDLSAGGNDFVANGFMAARREDEAPCPGLEADILIGISDVTREIKTSLTGLTGTKFIKARGAKEGELEKAACGDNPALHCQVISLYQGGQFKLYSYHRYGDVRLVFAPEFQAAFFGGDPDNFNFPRYALDAGFLRLYENGKPVATPDHLKWIRAAPKAGDPVFVAGNPGSTDRLMTASQLESLRDVTNPARLLMWSELRGRLIRFSEESDTNHRMAAEAVFEIENTFKAVSGEQQALIDPATIAGKRTEEAWLKSTVMPADRTRLGDPWADVATAQQAHAALYLPYYFLEVAPNISDLFHDARALVRAAEERQKPSNERLPEYADSRLPQLRAELLANTQVHKPLDQLFLAFRLSKAREYLTNDAPETELLLGKDSPEDLAAQLVDGSHLDDVAVRRKLWDGGWAAIEASDDPMIQYALKLDATARAARKAYEDRVTSPSAIAAQTIADIRFAAYGTGTYPDATFSLRLSFGKVAGWTYRGVTVPPFTYMKGLYDRATGQSPFVLAKSFAAAQDKFDKDTVYDFVTTNDIVSGNSGSPVINAKGEVIGAVFDGNIHSLGGAFIYDGTLNRAVVVSAAAVTEALDKVYAGRPLVKELTGR